MLEVEDLRVGYRGVDAVKGVSFVVDTHSITTIIGANGAGKSTLLNAVMGLLPSRGSIRFEGQPLTGLPPEVRVGLGLGLVAERRELFGSMSVEDNLLLGSFRAPGRNRKIANSWLAEVYELFPRMCERRSQQAGTLSGGERQMLAMGRALMGRPKLLMLDEPSLGLAPLIVREIFQMIRQLRDSGVSILLVEQNARAALQTSERGMLLENGEIALSGPSNVLAADPTIVERYLGQFRAEQDRRQPRAAIVATAG
ncbi:ABC transporter ATP-binding protein [Bradyrhizobium sp. LjRoot220]|uniref:ABC transporter ATP-binding protein n=1 Tax=Bradyrhizobium sp. LjRoot220 TaxID=3342284 RepID=UPI003ED0A23C